VEYVNNVSFIGDIKIILGTVKAVFNHSGITSETSATMEEFMGSEAEVFANE
jgi:pectin methylesterase-like acyl-CoA thioesterase